MKKKKLTMRKIIMRKISQCLALAIFLTAFLCTLFLYLSYENNAKNNVKEETRYIKIAVDNYGLEYLDKLNIEAGTRITIIDVDGNPLFDSEVDISLMNNHKDREEIKKALEFGEGSSMRNSDTLSVKNYYYAVLLRNGNVLRVATTMETLYASIAKMIFTTLTIAVIVFIIADLISYIIVDKVVKPINSIDLENPETNDIYSEIKPLLKRIKKQNEFIRDQTITESESRERMRREFSANVSHELKTPLTSISGYAELMKEGVVKPEDMTRFADIIYSEANRMITLVEDIIKISRLDEQTETIDWEEVDLYELTKETVERLEHAAKKRNVVVTYSGKSMVITGEKYILGEMLYNVIENAIKYNKENGLVHIKLYEKDNKRIVEIADTGIGIGQSDKDRVFERFYRVDKSHSRAIGGTGLGLSIVKHGAIFHHAEIEMDSELSIGTTIRMIFWVEKMVTLW